MKKRNQIRNSSSNSTAVSQAKKTPRDVDAEIQKYGALVLSSTGKTRKSACKKVSLLCSQELARLHREAGKANSITCVWTAPDGSEWARVDFPLELFSLIKRTATKLGFTLQQFFDNAIRHYAANCARRRAA